MSITYGYVLGQKITFVVAVLIEAWDKANPARVCACGRFHQSCLGPGCTPWETLLHPSNKCLESS